MSKDVLVRWLIQVGILTATKAILSRCATACCLVCGRHIMFDKELAN
jgi:hypothetical protein